MKILPEVDIFQDMYEADKYIAEIIKEEIQKTSAEASEEVSPA